MYQLLAAPFGATRSVYSFLRLSNAVWYIGVKALNIIWSCFFDDYVVFSRDEHVNNAEQSVSLLFKLLGWKFAEEGGKADTFSREFGALAFASFWMKRTKDWSNLQTLRRDPQS